MLHRPQQAFSQEDIGLAWQLGERVVLSQLDLIAYRNGDYFPDAGAWEDYRRASRHGMIAAERVLVLSEHTRGELIDEGLLAPERIRVIPPGLDHRLGETPRQPKALRTRFEVGARSRRRASRTRDSCSAWAPTTVTRTGCSPCACSQPCASITTGRERSCSPARTLSTAPRARPSARALAQPRSCATL